ncbi:molybdopterin-dependent oxidoreductase [Streptomyces sp. NBC_01428]|uniref:molybdopterin-dependent oxidoreductase n=1 Tax=Streptomyces sp. NBC_01428 TaxID=2903861 RepID=UPI002E3029A5|nr:molybdopterin-dependent oxidoreductase [Streptomyces sp. NBC_01428]
MPRSPSSPAFWRSPLRGPWFTSLLGVVLLVGITVMFVTGLLSYAAYNPNLAAVNDKTPDKGILGFYLFSWPTHPVWLYRLTQGVHVTLGITLIPVLLAKLWSVVPKLFALPPARSLAHALERLSLLLLVGGALFEFVTGVLNIQLDYIFPGSFYTLHFYGAWVFIAAFVTHAVLRVPMALRNLGAMRRRGEWPEGADAERSGGQPDRGSAADGPGPVSGSPGGSAGSASDRTGPAAGGRPGSAPEGPGPAPEGPGSAPEGTASGAGRPGTSPGTPGPHPGVSGGAPEDPGPVPDDAGRAPGGGGAVSGGAAGGGRPGASSGPARGEEGPHGGPDRVPGRSVPAPAVGEPARPEDELISPDPLPPTVSRRGAIAFVGGGSLLLAATTVGHSFDAPVRETALLAPHGGPEPGSGPGAFQINKTAASRGIDPKETGADAWRLVVAGNGRTVRLSRAQLQELPLHGSALPIACVEGWSTSDQEWRGVRLRDLAELVGYDTDTAPDVVVESLQRAGAFRVAALRYNQVRDPLSLLALSVNGADLTPDHGYPARIIVPAAPGVLNTKWVSRMTFGAL